MSYQPYPTGGMSNQVVTGPAGPQPRSIQNAVKLMYVGAGLEVVGLILTVTTIGSLRSAILKAYPHYTSSQVHSAEVSLITVYVAVAVIGAGLWLWMAWANGRGRRWARITAAVFFALYTVDMLTSVSRAEGAFSLVFGLLTWLVGLGATIFLWRRESTEFYAANRR